MNNGRAENTDATRYLCASAFVEGHLFRKNLFDLVSSPTQARALELGIDLGVVLSVCEFAERRELIYELARTAILLFSVLTVPATVINDSSFGIALIVVFVIFAVLLQWQKVRTESRVFIPLFYRDKYNVELVKQTFKYSSTSLEGDLLGTEEIRPNLIIFRDFDPFEHMGLELSRWNFTVDIQRAQRGGAEKKQSTSFETSELYDEVKMALKKLGDVEVDEVFCVHGKEIWHDADILPNRFKRPKNHLAPAVAERYRMNDTPRVRCFQWFLTRDERAECLSSHLLRCSFEGNRLFVEMAHRLMLPLQESYRKIDSLEGEIDSFWSTSTIALLAIFVAPLALLTRLLVRLERAHDIKRSLKNIRANCNYNYGAKSVRASHGGGLFSHYFQQSDSEYLTKSIDAQVLDCIIDFLEFRNVDVSQLRERRITILNQGLIVERGDVRAENLAVGESAQVNFLQTKAKSAS